MGKQRILRLLVFVIVVGAMIYMLSHFTEKLAQEEKKVLPAQVEKVIEKVRDLPEKTELSPLKEKVLGTFEKFVPEPLRKEEGKTEIERKVEKKVEGLIKEIKALPEEQLKEIKKEVFCREVCEETCQEICE